MVMQRGVKMILQFDAHFQLRLLEHTDMVVPKHHDITGSFIMHTSLVGGLVTKSSESGLGGADFQ
jgi:hypothetical protein